jgi:hypothetical protein
MKGIFILACALLLAGGSFAYSRGFDTTAFKSVFIPDAKNVNDRALKDFQVRFHDATEVLWYSDINGFTSYFTKDGFRSRTFYNKKGCWQYSLIYYGQDKLPPNIRVRVKSSYTDLDIETVVEMQSNYGLAYFVYMGNKSNLRILKVNEEGEMETTMTSVRG